MDWLVLVLVAGSVAAAVIYARGNSVRKLFKAQHMTEIATRLPQLKADALDAQPDDLPAGLRTRGGPILITYSSSRGDQGEHIHHLSLSTPATPARSAGTFFLAYVSLLLGLEDAPLELFVSERNAFHAVFSLDEAAHQAHVQRSVESVDAVIDRVVPLRDRMLADLEDVSIPMPDPE